MVQLIYASAATKPFSSEDLRALLHRARLRNALMKVSGILVYHGGSFLQVLEGAEENVATVFESIERDPRHDRTKVLLRQTIERREFGEWSMGFVDSGTAVTKPEGMVDYHRGLPELSDAATRARQYLRFFQNGLYRQ